ncbi:hypothetical protein DL98DRAFT_277951 [Cadophora sp. DSE1049]|nr:hypothetical protein DL98DRAFT_277951 [Cadophora sp. DSE1049]
MSAELPSSNPFRRKTPSTLPSAMSHPSTDIQISSQNEHLPPEAASIGQTVLPKKITKKVRVQSPPPPSPSTPSIPDSSSTLGEESYKTPGRPPSPPNPRADDPFDSVTSDTSEDEESSRLNKAPANPFSKTLETMENPDREAPISHTANTTTAGRASMDVEAFKRLLMTGNAGLGTPPAQPPAPAHVAHALGDGGSSTDTSSISRQSIFEAVQEPLPESPRTSHEISEPEDDRRGLMSEPSAAPRKKPPPPSSRHGKLIKVELRDENTPNALQSPPTPGSITSQHYFSSSPRSQTDLNKPLPPAPPRASHESERESVFDKESAGKTPEPPSPSSSIRRKNPPAPPLTRRHSQMVSESKLTRSNSARLSPKPEEELPRIPLQENRRPSTDSVRAPPPPPSRRPGAARGSSHTPLTSPSTVSLPAPPPARGSSRSVSGGKPPSVLSLDLSSTNTPNKRASVMAPPPPPPPPRHGRSSMDAQSPGNSQRPSGEYSRRSNETAQRGSNVSSAQQEELPEPANKHDILADLSKLQREIDALRQNETGRIT